MTRSGAESLGRGPVTASRGGPLNGSVTVPGDKSISHRALILGLLSVGETRIEGLLEGADVLATVRVCRQLGALIERTAAGAWRVYGRGLGALRAPDDILDFENSGTAARLMMGVIATHPIAAHLTGDASLRRRPMDRVLKPLADFGALARSRGGRLPIYLEGAERPVPIEYELPVASAQVKSAVLLAALNTAGDTTVIERIATRDHTERMLAHFGADIRVEADAGKRMIVVKGQPELRPHPIAVPGDPSSAAFLIVAALIVPGSRVTVRDVLLNPARIGLLTTLLEMGASIAIGNEREVGGERVGDITAEACALKGVDVPATRAASMIDEYPVLGVAAAFAEGRTRMNGLEELRLKESDRLAAIAAGLAANGIAAKESEAALEVEGRGPDGVPGGGTVLTHMDHRIAMAFLTLGLAAKAPVTVDDGSMIATSFPNYVELMRGLGADIHAAS
jgi:3-phosphoshikimate 1-carboxyvinyltransferase